MASKFGVCRINRARAKAFSIFEAQGLNTYSLHYEWRYAKFWLVALITELTQTSPTYAFIR